MLRTAKWPTNRLRGDLFRIPCVSIYSTERTLILHSGRQETPLLSVCHGSGAWEWPHSLPATMAVVITSHREKVSFLLHNLVDWWCATKGSLMRRLWSLRQWPVLLATAGYEWVLLYLLGRTSVSSLSCLWTSWLGSPALHLVIEYLYGFFTNSFAL